MNYDNEWLEQLLENRSKAIRDSIRPATIEEVRELGQERFPSATDPWAEGFKAFLDEHPRDRYYLARTSEGAEVVYCRDAGKGIWFLPGRGMGLLQPKGLQRMAAIVDGH
jgi:hypothetical protein